jgi:hypothetical protein
MADSGGNLVMLILGAGIGVAIDRVISRGERDAMRVGAFDAGYRLGHDRSVRDYAAIIKNPEEGESPQHVIDLILSDAKTYGEDSEADIAEIRSVGEARHRMFESAQARALAKLRK